VKLKSGDAQRNVQKKRQITGIGGSEYPQYLQYLQKEQQKLDI